MNKKNHEEKLDYKKLNEIIVLSKNILKISHILLLIISIYAITLIFEKWAIIAFLLTIIDIITPFFIGFIIAWLLNPFVLYLQKKNITRTLGTIIVYSVLLLFLYYLFSGIIPLLSAQVNDFLVALPNMIDILKNWTDTILQGFGNTNNIDINPIRIEIFNLMETYEKNITTNLPTIALAFFTSFISSVGNLLLGLLIGFFMLFDFNTVSSSIIKLVPERMKKDFKVAINTIDETLKHFVSGMLLLSFVVFIVSTIAFYLIGLKAPILFGLICGITNVIPILGPYIGGFVAVTVGFTQSVTIGILVFIVIIFIQIFEGEFIMPFVMSKAMKLHAVTIIVALLIFGHLFGIIGMIISTPIVAIMKTLFFFLNNKFKLFNLN